MFRLQISVSSQAKKALLHCTTHWNIDIKESPVRGSNHWRVKWGKELHFCFLSRLAKCVFQLHYWCWPICKQQQFWIMKLPLLRDCELPKQWFIKKHVCCCWASTCILFSFWNLRKNWKIHWCFWCNLGKSQFHHGVKRSTWQTSRKVMTVNLCLETDHDDHNEKFNSCCAEG